MTTGSIRSAVVICTKDRPHEVEMACAAAGSDSPEIPIVVVDSSETDATLHLCERLSRARGAKRPLIYRRARPPLTRQRNTGIEICRDLNVDVVHFIDDDTEVRSGYFDAINRRFEVDGEVMGIGGIVINQPRLAHVGLKRVFLLASPRPGTVLRSGRNVLGQYPDSRATDPVEWLSGCSMSYRLCVFEDLLFDTRREGTGGGEDCDLSYRLGRDHGLAVEPAARCIHHLTETNRGSGYDYARHRTIAIHRWVKENRPLGLSLVAFWWSALGDFLLRGGYGVLGRDRRMLLESLGVLHGGAAILGASLRPR